MYRRAVFCRQGTLCVSFSCLVLSRCPLLLPPGGPGRCWKRQCEYLALPILYLGSCRRACCQEGYARVLFWYHLPRDPAFLSEVSRSACLKRKWSENAPPDFGISSFCCTYSYSTCVFTWEFLNTIINIRGGKRVHACHSRSSQLPMERNLNHDRLYYVRVPFEYLYTCRYLLV